MATIESPAESINRTPTLADLADLVDQLDLPLARILLRPQPGSATPDDVTAIHDREGRLCELIDGTLVEKTMGFTGGFLASVLVHILWNFVLERDLGIVLGPDAAVRMGVRQVRIPDVAFYSWARLPDGKLPGRAIPELVPDLAVEVLSPNNTAKEMDRKLGEYFAAGCRLVWYMDPPTRSVRVCSAKDHVEVVGELGVLDGGAVLPGFGLAVADWFARAERPGAGG